MVAIKTEDREGYRHITVQGEIDASSSIELDNALSDASRHSAKILIDLQGLEYISSAGLGVFISYLEDMKRHDIRLVIFGLQDKVREVFDILGLQHLMKIAKDEADGLQQLNEA